MSTTMPLCAQYVLTNTRALVFGDIGSLSYYRAWYRLGYMPGPMPFQPLRCIFEKEDLDNMGLGTKTKAVTTW